MSVKTDNEHYARTEKYAKEVQSLYFQIADHVARISSTQAFKAGIFTFKDYPVLNRMIDKLIESLRKSMLVVIRSGISKEWDNANENNDALVKYLSSKINLPEKKYKTRNLKALEAFQGRKTNGLGLSERVWNYATQYKTELEQALDVGIADGRSASQLSRDIREYLREPEKLFRRVRDKNGILKPSKNALKYNPGGGVYRSSYKNAMRLTRTEINQSYREADYLRWQQMDFVVGIEIRRSNHEYGCPVCESLKGKYPKDFKFIGWHPHCLCHAIPILSTQKELLDSINDETPVQSKNEVKDMPKNFTKWMDENSHRMKSDTQVYDINKEWERIKNVQVDLTQIYGKDTEKVKFRLATPEQTIKVGDFNKVNERINIDIEFPVNIIKSDGTVIKSSGFNSSMTATIDNEKKIITLMKVDVDEKLRRNGIAEYMAWKVKEVTPKGYTIVGSGVYSGGGSGLVAKLEKTGYFKNVSVSKKQLPYWMKENEKLINILELMEKAKSAETSVSSLSNSIAEKFGGYSTPVNFKSYDSIKRKANSDYNGNVNKIQDSIRTTIILPEKNIEKCLEYIQKNTNFIRIKIQTPDKFMGYSGTITNAKTNVDVIGEIQVNTAKMIYAKEEPKTAKVILGVNEWNRIKKETGMPGGLGHKYYEEFRKLNKNIPEQAKRMIELDKLSNEYYKHFR